MDCSPPGSSILGVLQARILEWVAIPSGDLPHPVSEPTSLLSLALAGGFFTTSATWEEPQIKDKFDIKTTSQERVQKSY